VRIKSRFHNKSRPKSLEEIAGALGFNLWRMVHSTVNKMYSDGFNFTSNRQLLDTIAEYLAFLLQVVDRQVYDRMDTEQRRRFVTALALHLAGTMEENRIEEEGPGEHRGPFIDLLNERLEAYSEFAWSETGPSYPFLRYLGTRIDACMGVEHNKWVLEQVMEVEAPALLKQLDSALEDLLAQSEVAAPGERA